jgi:hypothetical protein
MPLTDTQAQAAKEILGADNPNSQGSGLVNLGVELAQNWQKINELFKGLEAHSHPEHTTANTLDGYRRIGARGGHLTSDETDFTHHRTDIPFAKPFWEFFWPGTYGSGYDTALNVGQASKRTITARVYAVHTMSWAQAIGLGYGAYILKTIVDSDRGIGGSFDKQDSVFSSWDWNQISQEVLHNAGSLTQAQTDMVAFATSIPNAIMPSDRVESFAAQGGENSTQADDTTQQQQREEQQNQARNIPPIVPEEPKVATASIAILAGLFLLALLFSGGLKGAKSA